MSGNQHKRKDVEMEGISVWEAASHMDNVLLVWMRMNSNSFNTSLSQYTLSLSFLGTRILGDSVINKMEKFSFPTTLNTSKVCSLYKLQINFWHLHVCSFAIQWFYFCKKKLHFLKKNMSQRLKIQLRYSESLMRAPVPTYTHLAVFASSREIPMCRSISLVSRI